MKLAFWKKDELTVSNLIDVFDQHTPKYTPDIHLLEQHWWNPVFIPDDCMIHHSYHITERGSRHDLVKEGASGYDPFYEDCYTAKPFTFLEKNLGKQSFPIPFDPINDNDLPMWMNKSHRIKGELYALSSKSIIELDNHRLNTVQFDRVKVTINIPYAQKYRDIAQSYNGVWSSTYRSSKTNIVSIQAHMYVGRFEYWRDQLLKLDNFSPVKVEKNPDRIYVKDFYNYKNQSHS